MSHGHIYAVASGFGLRLIPARAPYKIRLGPAPTLDAECQHADGWRFCRVTPNGGGYRSQVDQHTRSLTDVLDIVAGPAWQEWWIETTHYRVPLPEGWTAYSAGDGGGALFDLLGPNDSCIFVQTPDVLPQPDALVAPGQRVVREGSSRRSSWIEVEYVHAGERWHQRHEWQLLDAMPTVISLQARGGSEGQHRPVLQRIVEQVRRRRGDGEGTV